MIRTETLQFWLMVLCLLVCGAARGQDADTIRAGEEDTRNPFRVSGVVRGPGGPAEGVQVLLEISDMSIRRQVAFRQTRTDSDGRFTFDLRDPEINRYGLQFNTVSPRFIETLKIVQIDRTELPHQVELEVEPGTLASGTVKDAAGLPLEGVEITAPNVRKQNSNEDGEWESFGIAPGTAELRFTKEGYAPAFLTVRSAGPEILEGFEVVLESARQFVVKVVDRRQAPIPYAVIVMDLPGLYISKQADDKGEFVFKGVPEAFDSGAIEASKEGLLPNRHELSGEEIAASAATIILDHGSFVEGVVTLPGGLPGAGSRVVAGLRDQRQMPRVYADTTGRWRMGPFPPGVDQTFTALPPSSEPTWGIADLVLTPAAVPNRFTGVVELWPKGFSSDFAAEVAATTVTLTRRDEGEGGFGAEVRYTGALGPDGNITGTLEVFGMEQEGKFTMIPRNPTGSLAGEWELREEIGASDLKVAPVMTSLKLPAVVGVTSLDLALTESKSIEGVVLFEDDRPFIDGSVYLLEWNGSTVYHPEAPIGAGGRFKMDRLPDGCFMLMAVSGDHESQTSPVPAIAGMTNLVLREGPPKPDPVEE